MNKKITELNELLNLSSNDILLVVDDPSLGGETKYVTAATLLDFLNGPNTNPNEYNTTILLDDSNIKSSVGITFSSNMGNSISFNSESLSGLIKSMQINIGAQEKASIEFYSAYLDKPITIFIEGVVYNTTFINGIKNLW